MENPLIGAHVGHIIGQVGWGIIVQNGHMRADCGLRLLPGVLINGLLGASLASSGSQEAGMTHTNC